MFFPDDVISIISAYSKPLKRISKSKFWIDNLVSEREMISVVLRKFELYIGSISMYFRVEHFRSVKYWSVKAWSDGNTFLHCILRFTLDDVIQWNGRTFESDSTPIWRLTKDSIYTFGVHRNKLVKLIKIKQPVNNHKQLYFC